MTEIQGKSILVRVSARFELARVRVTGSRLYLYELLISLRRSGSHTHTQTLYQQLTCMISVSDRKGQVLVEEGGDTGGYSSH